MRVVLKNSNEFLGAYFVATHLKLGKKLPIEISWGEQSVVENFQCRTSNDVARALTKGALQEFYGKNPSETTEVDHWLTFALGPLSSKFQFFNAIQVLDQYLGSVTYLANKRLTIADFVVFAALFVSKFYADLETKKSVPINVLRWFKFIAAQNAVKISLNQLTVEQKDAILSQDKTKKIAEIQTSTGRKAEGKFIDLPGAEMGKVVVRFPPEASGYLHIGHAKAALLNQYYQENFQGKLIMRFDDTNPAKENPHFEKVILEDVAMLEIKPDRFTHTSQYFDLMIDYCEKLLKTFQAYVDDTEAELMKLEREQKRESKNRNLSVEDNLKIWQEMLQGTEIGQKFCVRAKIDMQSANGCLRDPTIYRCKNEEHPRTGKTYKVYPTYDFACPIVDAIEGVTHTLRTMEYHDRDAQFYWFIDALGLRKPFIWEYSRLSMTNTVLSKRKLTWFVEQGLVDGWDDPRMPTVRGVLRRGMTVQGLKEFIVAQGSSRSVVFMEWDKIWAINKKVIDPIAPRYSAVDKDHVEVFVEGVNKEEKMIVQKHPKNKEIGTKEVWISARILIDRLDADLLREGENATFINWGNLLIKKIHKDHDKIQSIEAELNLSNKDYKKTVKLTWLARTEDPNNFTLTYLVYFDHLISKNLLAKDEDFKKFVGHSTRKEVEVLGDPELKHLKKGDIIQIQRKGFFRVDIPYEKASPFTCRPQPVVLFYVPDGSAKENLPFLNAEIKAKPNSTESLGNVKIAANSSAPPQKSENSSSSGAGGDIKEILTEKVNEQGNVVRDLKSQKAEKAQIDEAVKKLLECKAEYKRITGEEFPTPGKAAASKKHQKSENSPPSGAGGDIKEILTANVNEQGNVVRELKSKKAEKAQIDEAVKKLLECKAEYKRITGEEFPAPGKAAASKKPQKSENSSSSGAGGDIKEILTAKVNHQGSVVRELKSKKAEKTQIDEAVKKLLECKAEYKRITGEEFPAPGKAAASKKLEKSENTPSSGGDTKDVLIAKVNEQGDVVRELKSKKAEKAQIDEAVKKLLECKAEYKRITGEEFPAPGKAAASKKLEKSENTPSSGGDTKDVLIAKVNAQGDVVRELKSKKAEKTQIDEAVKKLLECKAEYKRITGEEFPAPGKVAASKKPQKSENSSSSGAGGNIKEILTAKVNEQGNVVRDLKSKKAEKAQIDEAVKNLLECKAEYKRITGEEFPAPGKAAASKKPQKSENSSSGAGGDTKDVLIAKVNEQGDVVRELKSKKAEKAQIDEAVKKLLECKAEYKRITGEEFPAPGKAAASKKPKETGTKEKEKSPPIEPEESAAGANNKKQTRLGLEARKEENLSDWYSQVITKGEMIEYYDVSGCYIFRPWSYAIWEVIKEWLDGEIKKLGVQNCYFPIFVSKSVLEKEKTHIADFAPEVAWVTKSGDSELAEPIAVRPTSETVMYPAYAKWIQSYRDLPIKLNQWNNVVRWEFKHPQPFLRTREFLWQEGHSAFATKPEADREVETILDLYAQIYEDLLAIPVIKGRKTEKEKFAGGDYTLTVEAFISASGRAIQGATSHHLGQNFSRMFEIVYEDPDTQEKRFVYQNSWGITTRTIGVLIMVHADNQGLVLPPKIASIQVVLVPCGLTANLTENAKLQLHEACNSLENSLNECGIRVKGDYRLNYSPGWKFNHWELKGVPIRIELGPKDLEKNQFVAVRRDTGEKITFARNSAGKNITELLDTIQSNLFNKAKIDLESHKILLTDWTKFGTNLDRKNIILAPFCGDSACEDKIKADSARDEDAEPGAPSMGAKTLCIPLEQPEKIKSTDKCIYPECKNKPKFYTLFGRSY